MDWGTALSDVNYVAVLAAVVASFAIGFVWYDMRVFGDIWRKGVGLSKKDMESTDGMVQIFTATAVFNVVSTIFLAALLIGLGTETASEGALNGAVLGFTIVGLRMAIHNNFARKSLDHSMIEGGYDVLVMAVQGAIIGALV